MPRRSLSVVAAAAAAIAFVPGTASAAPDDAPVVRYFASSYDGTADFVLPDGRTATASLSKFRGASTDEWRGALRLDVTTPCSTPTGCYPSTGFGSTEVTGDQITFDRRLRTASVEDVTISVVTSGFGGSGLPGGGTVTPPPYDWPPLPPTDEVAPPLPGYELPPPPPPLGFDMPPADQFPMPPGAWIPPVPTTETFVVSLTFTGTGELTHEVTHQYGQCGDGSSDCQSIRTYDRRASIAVLTLDGVAEEPASGLLTLGTGHDVAGKPNGMY
jgi:hypothetical protein